MAGISITISVDDRAARSVFAKWERADGDLSGLLDPIGAALRDNVLDRFEHGRGPDGTAWPESLRATEQSGQTLVDKGRLRDSITYEAGAREVELGSNVIYARIHQLGGTITAKTDKGLSFSLAGDGGFVNVQSVTLPPRPYLGIGPEDIDAIGDMFEAWARAPIAAAGRASV